MTADIPRIKSLLNFFVNALVMSLPFQCLKHCHIFEDFISYHQIMILSCILVTKHKGKVLPGLN
jgi:hypothetical protein